MRAGWRNNAPRSRASRGRGSSSKLGMLWPETPIHRLHFPAVSADQRCPTLHVVNMRRPCCSAIFDRPRLSIHVLPPGRGALAVQETALDDLIRIFIDGKMRVPCQLHGGNGAEGQPNRPAASLRSMPQHAMTCARSHRFRYLFGVRAPRPSVGSGFGGME